MTEIKYASFTRQVLEKSDVNPTTIETICSRIETGKY
jgi:hypothetical protein